MTTASANRHGPRGSATPSAPVAGRIAGPCRRQARRGRVPGSCRGLDLPASARRRRQAHHPPSRPAARRPRSPAGAGRRSRAGAPKPNAAVRSPPSCAARRSGWEPPRRTGPRSAAASRCGRRFAADIAAAAERRDHQAGHAEAQPDRQAVDELAGRSRRRRRRGDMVEQAVVLVVVEDQGGPAPRASGWTTAPPAPGRCGPRRRRAGSRDARSPWTAARSRSPAGCCRCAGRTAARRTAGPSGRSRRADELSAGVLVLDEVLQDVAARSRRGRDRRASDTPARSSRSG